MERKKRERLPAAAYPVMVLILAAAVLICVSAGTEPIDPRITVETIWNELRGLPAPDTQIAKVIRVTRLPRVLCAALIGAALSLCGAAMQGLLRNPLADGGILGVSTGGALGSALAVVTGFTVPGIELGGNVIMSMIFSFGSMMLVLLLAYSMDRSLSTYTIILIGVVFSMLASALLSLLFIFEGDKLKMVTYLTMGTLQGKRMKYVVALLPVVVVFGGILLAHARELNHFALGEENARRVGVPVRRVKLIILIAASALIGVSVAVGGTIAFVGLIVPHMVRMITGPNHRKVLPVSIFAGAVFLMLADLAARTILASSKSELPVGVVTSLIGAVAFAGIFRSSRKGGKRRAGG